MQQGHGSQSSNGGSPRHNRISDPVKSRLHKMVSRMDDQVVRSLRQQFPLWCHRDVQEAYRKYVDSLRKRGR